MRYQKHIVVFFILLALSVVAIENSVLGWDGMRMISKQKTNFNKPRTEPPLVEQSIEDLTKNFDAAKIYQEPLMTSEFSEPRLAIRIPSDIIVENKNIISNYSQKSSILPKKSFVTVTPKRQDIVAPQNILKMTVLGEDDLSGEYKISKNNTVHLPLIGLVKVNKASVRETKNNVIKKYKNGYLKKPEISLEIISDQEFFILGEVNNPGRYQHMAGIDMRQAVAMADGYTSLANQDSADVWRNSKAHHNSFQMTSFDMVEAGDIIFVRGRSF